MLSWSNKIILQFDFEREAVKQSGEDIHTLEMIPKSRSTVFFVSIGLVEENVVNR